MNNNERHRLRLRPPPGEMIPKWPIPKELAHRYAETVCGLAVANKISPNELLDWYFGDLLPPRSQDIEKILDPQHVRGLLWVLGYYSPSGKSPLVQGNVTETDLVEQLQPASGRSFYQEFKALLVVKQHPSPESPKGKLGPRRRVMGNWPNEGGPSRA